MLSEFVLLIGGDYRLMEQWSPQAYCPLARLEDLPQDAGGVGVQGWKIYEL